MADFNDNLDSAQSLAISDMNLSSTQLMERDNHQDSLYFVSQRTIIPSQNVF